MKNIYKWDETLQINIVEIDLQHKRFIDIVNELHNAMTEGKGKSVLANVLKEVDDFLKVHFSHEEKLLKDYGYPDYNGHKKLHDNFVNKVNEIKEKQKTEIVGVTIKVSQLLINWFFDHIRTDDQKYVPFLMSKGVK